MAEFADLQARFKPREKVVMVAMAGDLLAEHETLSEELDAALAATRTSLADGTSTQQLAERITELEALIEASRVPIRFRGVGRNRYKRLEQAHPDPDGGSWNLETFPAALIAAAAVDPVMTPEQVGDLADMITEGEFARLFQGAFSSCNDANDVPFNGRASLVNQH